MSNGSSNEYPDSEEELDYVSIYILIKTAEAIVEHATPLYDKTLYHTYFSSFGQSMGSRAPEWPSKVYLLRACSVFYALIKELSTMGLKPSRNIMSEEKLLIFLYKCVTGLSVEHVGEHVQHSNHTISEYSSLSYFIDFH